MDTPRRGKTIRRIARLREVIWNFEVTELAKLNSALRELKAHRRALLSETLNDEALQDIFNLARETRLKKIDKSIAELERAVSEQEERSLKERSFFRSAERRQASCQEQEGRDAAAKDLSRLVELILQK